jgi:hypothetical protein
LRLAFEGFHIIGTHVLCQCADIRWLSHTVISLLQGYGPLQSWIHELMLQLHKPATLPPSPAGFDVTIAPGASAVLDALVRVSHSNRAVNSISCTFITF